jgi:hypothetical protein
MRSIRPFRNMRALALPAIAVALVSIAAPAQANVGEEIIRRCTHAESLSGFTQKQYQEALKDLSAGTEEYSNCAQLIRQAQLAAAGAGRGGGYGGGPATPAASTQAATPSEQRAIARAPSAGAAPLQVGAQTIRPGVVHADIASALSSLPTPLLATVAFLTICLLAAAGAGIRNRIRNVRRPD